jgi:carbonic anhydrase
MYWQAHLKFAPKKMMIRLWPRSLISIALPAFAAGIMAIMACEGRAVSSVETKAHLSHVGPSDILDNLKTGNRRFVEGHPWHYNYTKQVALTADEQAPGAVVLTCMDSRVAPEILFNQGLGALFTIRVAGNVVSPEILGSMEYACGHAGSKVIVVLGHTHCGAISGACSLHRHTAVHAGIPEPGLDVLMGDLEAAVAQAEKTLGTDAKEEDLISQSVLDNVRIDLERIRRESPELAALERAGHILITGAVYDVRTGKVVFLEE